MKYIWVLILFLNGVFVFPDNGRNMPHNITNIFDRGHFEAVVEYVLENGTWGFSSSLWGLSPGLHLNGFSIALTPDLANFRHFEFEGGRTYTGMSILHFWRAATADVRVNENGVYIISIVNMSASGMGYDEHLDRLINVIIPQIKGLIQ